MKMKAAGIVVEYNPLHNGHLYHIQETKKLTQCDILIAVMSGNFLQRGEPALLPKYSRSKMALQAGADIVIELPYAYATQKAETFASGAISILQDLKAQEMCFGSESGQINDFFALVQQKEDNHAIFQTKVQEKIKQGISYPKALSEALASITSSALDVSLPNNILGMHYVEAIKKNGGTMIPKTIKRFGANYHDTDIHHEIASATSIRKILLEEELNTTSITSVAPPFTTGSIEQYKQKYGTVHFWELYFPFLQYTLLTKSKEELQQIYEVEEGLENRILTQIATSHSFKDFMEGLKTKRYTWTRLQRLCVHILTNTTKEQMQAVEDNVPYLKLLGMTRKGQSYLSSIKKHLPVPLVANDKSYKHPLLALDQKATAAYYAVLPSTQRVHAIRNEWNHSPLIFSV